MKTSDFNFELPNELIADVPAVSRDESKLMILSKNGQTTHKKFRDILDHLGSNDVLVFNNTKVFPARLIGRKKSTGGKIELLLNHEISDSWEVVGKNLQKNSEIEFFGSKMKAKVLDKRGQISTIKFSIRGKDFLKEVDKIGHVPLPPYIESKRKENHTIYDNDKERYQTVYAKKKGSVAAPTAGLHFTNSLIEKLKQKGVKIFEITLHVGLGTFAPVKTEEIENHQIHKEFYQVSRKVLNELVELKQSGHRIVSVGTTTTRVLEHLFKNYPASSKYTEDQIGWTDIYIYPGYNFKFIDRLITNFHLPKSSLLFLVSAFAGKDIILSAYQEAIRQKYRFYSYGDAMFID